MSIFQKLNLFRRPDPDELLADWIRKLEDRCARDARKWHRSGTGTHYFVREWASERDLEQLALILDLGPDLARVRVLPGRKKDEHWAAMDYPERPVLDAVLGVSGRGAEMLLKSGARATQSTLKTLFDLAVNHRVDGSRNHYERKARDHHLFSFRSVALELIKSPGVNWYFRYQQGQGRYRYASTAVAVELALGRESPSFTQHLETEQARRGWQVGHPPLEEWFSHKGKVDMHSVQAHLSECAEQSTEYLLGQRQSVVSELLSLGADPGGRMISSHAHRHERMVDYLVRERDYPMLDQLLAAGAQVDWVVCEHKISDLLRLAITPQGIQASDDTSWRHTRWKIMELLRTACKYDMPENDRPFQFKAPEKARWSQAQEASWPRTWGALFDYLGEGSRAEIEHIHMTHCAPKAQAQQTGRRL